MLHLCKIALFLVLSVADFCLTWLLLQDDRGLVGEGNPVAVWFLNGFGWVGLAAFKAGAVLVFVGVVYLITTRNPRLAGRVLALGCGVMAVVVGYSGYLVHAMAYAPERLDPAVAEVSRVGDGLDAGVTQSRDYSLLLHKLAGDVADGRITLAAGAAQLAASPKGRSSDWRGHLQEVFPLASIEEIFAVHLMHHALLNCARNGGCPELLACDLEAEFQATFAQSGHTTRRLPRFKICPSSESDERNPCPAPTISVELVPPDAALTTE